MQDVNGTILAAKLGSDFATFKICGACIIRMLERYTLRCRAISHRPQVRPEQVVGRKKHVACLAIVQAQNGHILRLSQSPDHWLDAIDTLELRE
jgi:hypothetical protein